jgi:hypothetical protein
MLLTPWANADLLFYEGAPINYSYAKPNDPIAEMILPYEQEKLGFDNTSKKALLRSLLDRIDIPLGKGEPKVKIFSATTTDLPASWQE